MPVLDPFGQGFQLGDLTAAVNKVPFVPGQVLALGIYEERAIVTPTVLIEAMGASSRLVATQDRAAPVPGGAVPLRRMVRLATRRVAVQGAIPADQLIQIRAFGQDGAAGIDAHVRQVFDALTPRIDATVEHLALGGTAGLVTDADGSTLYDYFAEFGVPQPAEIGLNLAAATAAQLQTALNQLVRGILESLGGASYERIVALCSPGFWDALTSNQHVKTAYERALGLRELAGQQAWLAEGKVARPQWGFWFGGVYWIEYHGAQGGPAVAADRAYVFPAGVPGMFQLFYAPADYLGAQGPGLPRYARQLNPTPDGRLIPIEVSTYPLAVCTRPEALRRVRHGA